MPDVAAEMAWARRPDDMDQWNRDLTYAARVQSLLTGERSTAIPGAVVTGVGTPHYLVGGDYFDFLPSPDGGLRLIVADVMGKGLAPALLATMAYATVRALSHQYPSPADLLRRLNDDLYADLQKVAAFITMLVADVAPGGRQVTIASAGHPRPFILRRGQAAERIMVKGVSLGMLPKREYQEVTVTVESGDRLVLYTDGLPDTKNSEGRELGADGLERMALKHTCLSSFELLHAVIDDVVAYAGGINLQDDATLVLADFVPTEPAF